MIVIDASGLAKYVLHEEDWEQVGEYIKSKRPLASVDHVLKEVGNAIWKHCHQVSHRCCQGYEALREAPKAC